MCLSDYLCVCLPVSLFIRVYVNLAEFSSVCLHLPYRGLYLLRQNKSLSLFPLMLSMPRTYSNFDHYTFKIGQKIYRGKGAKQLAAELEAGQQLKGETADKTDATAVAAMGPPRAPAVGVSAGHEGMKITDFDADADRPTASSNAVSFSFTDIKRTSDEEHNNAGDSADHATDPQDSATALSSSVYKAHSESEASDVGSSSSAEEAVSGIDTEMQTTDAHSLSDQTSVQTVDSSQQNEKGSDEEVLDTCVRDQGQSQSQGQGHTERTKRKFNDLDDVQTNEFSDHRKETEAEGAEIDINLPPIEQLEEAVAGTSLLIP